MHTYRHTCMHKYFNLCRHTYTYVYNSNTHFPNSKVYPYTSSYMEKNKSVVQSTNYLIHLPTHPSKNHPTNK